MCSREMCCAQDAVVARQYISDRKTFENTARMWTGERSCPARAQALLHPEGGKEEGMLGAVWVSCCIW